MPIRFRCYYCQQLMAISTRKAGTVVRCPKCEAEIIVPVPDGMQPPAESGEPPASEKVVDKDDLAHYVEEPVNGSASRAPSALTETAAAPETAVPPAPAPAADPEPIRRGVFLSWGMLFVSLGVVIVLLIVMFAIGLMIGRQSAIPDV